MRHTMVRILILLGSLLMFMGPVRAQPVQALVVSACGTVPVTLTNGTPGPFTMDTTGKICTSGSGGGGGLSVTDQTAWVQGTSAFTPSGGVFNDTATLSSGQEGTFRLTTKRAQIVDVDSSGNQLHTDLSNINTSVQSPITSGTNIIGKVGIDQSTPGTSNAVQATNFPSTVSTGTGAQGASSPRVTVATDTATIAGSAPGTAGAASANVVSVQGVASMTPVLVQPQAAASGGGTTFYLEPTASDNHTVIKNGAGTVYSIHITNNSATKNYWRLYDAGTGFNGCNSATNRILGSEIPPSDSGVSFLFGGEVGATFGTGLSLCVTSGYGSTDTTNATASAMMVNVIYK